MHIAIVPGRKGSKRLPGKNRMPLGGVPLFIRAIKTGLASKCDVVVLSTDDEKSLADVKALADDAIKSAMTSGRLILIQRPDALATDEAPAIDYVRHVIKYVEKEVLSMVTSTSILQPTSPFTEAEDVNACLDMLERAQSDSVVSVMEIEHHIHPRKLKFLADDMRLLPAMMEEEGKMAASELERIYVRNGAVYTSARAAIMEQNSILGQDSRGYLMPRERSIDINDKMDFEFAEFLMSKSNILCAPGCC